MTGKFFGEIPAMRFSGFFTILIIAALLALPVTAYAAEITYAGDGGELQEAPAWFPLQHAVSLFPGTSAAPLSHGNKISIDYDPGAPGVTNPDFVFGGLGKLGMGANNNSVAMSNGTVRKDIYGGWSYTSEAVGNAVAVNGGSVHNSIYGGWSRDGAVRDNSVAVSLSRIGQIAFGGSSVEGDVTNNTLTARDISVGSIGGGWSYDGDAVENTIVVGGDSLYSEIFGGMSGDGSAVGNKVTLSAGMVYGNVFGGFSGNGSGNAIDNAVAVSGGIVEDAIYGGINSNGDAMDNTVTVSGGIMCRLVYGGLAVSGNATGNTVTINGCPRGLAEAHIYGGHVDDESRDSFSGNTLKLNSHSILAEGVGNFEYYNFSLPQNLAAGGVILSVTEPVDLKGTTVVISLQDGSKLKKGDKIALIHSAAGVSNAPKNKSCKVKRGGALYEFSIYTDSNNLWAKAEKVSNATK